jgi:hypothetical protein
LWPRGSSGGGEVTATTTASDETLLLIFLFLLLPQYQNQSPSQPIPVPPAPIIAVAETPLCRRLGFLLVNERPDGPTSFSIFGHPRDLKLSLVPHLFDSVIHIAFDSLFLSNDVLLVSDGMVVGGGFYVEEELEVPMDGMKEVLGVEGGEGNEVIETPICTLLKLVLEATTNCFCEIYLVNQKDLVFVHIWTMGTIYHLQVH